MKLRVIQSDGMYKGGLLKYYGPNGEDVWRGRNGASSQEHLLHRNSCWYLLCFALIPDWSGSEKTDDLMDHNSYAQILTVEQAMKWCAGQIFEPPAVLCEAAAAAANAGPSDQSQKEPRFTYRQLSQETGLSLSTLRRYRRQAGIQADRGKRNRSFSAAEIRQMADAHRRHNPNNAGLWANLLRKLPG